MEAKLFSDTSHVSTFAFHEHRERAPHLEQPHHRPRLEAVAGVIRHLAVGLPSVTVSDLGCGDGGLLQLLSRIPNVHAWGYDFQPSNVAGWAERGVRATQLDVFNQPGQPGFVHNYVDLGDIVVMTEVIEHLEQPHQVLAELHSSTARTVVASSPWDESHASHDACHAWAWNMEGYANMFSGAGWAVQDHFTVDRYQIMVANHD